MFPPLSGPSRTFVFDRELWYPVGDSTKRSRFVLYDNGAFALQYQGRAGDGLRGRYVEANGDINFEWEDRSPVGGWAAVGILRDDTLSVQYNWIMWATDFEDAVYVLMP